MGYAIRNDKQGWRAVDSAEDVLDGEYYSEDPVEIDPPPLTPEQIIEAMRAAIQAHMDNAAQGYGYDDIKAAVTYADEPAVPKFQAEGRALRAWRSLVWAHAYGVLADVQAGEREQPTIEEVIAELPELVIEV